MNMHRGYVLYVVASCAIFVMISYLLYHTITYDAHFDHDSLLYDRIARQFSDTHQLVDPHDAHNAPIQTVAYPFILGCVYYLTGNAVWAVILLQVLLVLATILVVHRIARRWFGQTVAAVSVALCALNLGFITYTQLVLAEIVLTFLLLLFLERCTLFMSHRSLSVLAQAGLALGISLVVKPIALLLPVVLVPVVWCCSSAAHRLHTSTLFVGACYAPVIAYMVRNALMYGVFALAPMMSLNMYQCFLSKVIGRLEQRSSYEVAQTTLVFQSSDPFNEQGWDTARTLFYEYLFAHPALFLRMWFENVSKTLFGLFSTQFKQLYAERNNPEQPHSFFALQGSCVARCYAYVVGGCQQRSLQLLALVEALWSIVRWFFIVGACIMLYRQRLYSILFVCGMYVFVLAAMTGMDGCCRYRMMVEPVLLIFSAFGMCVVYRYVEHFKKQLVHRVV